MRNKSDKKQRRTARIPVIATLLYRAVGMDNFESCQVANVSTLSLEMMLDHVLPEGTVVTISACSGDANQQYHHIVGRILRVQQRNGMWMHVVTASAQRPWSPLFIYDVVCSTTDPAMKHPVEQLEVEPQHFGLEECLDLLAWDATILPERPMGLDYFDDQASTEAARVDDFSRAGEAR